MKIKFSQINADLRRQCGHGIKLCNDPRGQYPYVLRFDKDNPPAWEIDKAIAVVNSHMPSTFFKDKMRPRWRER